MDRFKNNSYSPLSDGTQEDAVSIEGSLKRNSSLYAHQYDVKHGSARMPTRIKKGRVMRWLVLNHTGERQLLNLEKRQLQQAFGLDLPVRDMRLLDSQLVDFKTIGQILVRNNVILVSMEHVRCIITAKEVIVPVEENEKSEVCARFCMWLESMVQEYVAEAAAEKQRLEAEEAEGQGELPATPSLFNRSTSSSRGPTARPRLSFSQANTQNGIRLGSYNEVPFELHVLEVALGEVSTHLAREAEILQAQAHPALEELTKEADQPVLERVRRIKTSHQRLLGRVRLVRDVLERLMEDDREMMRMTLTRTQNLALQQRDSQNQRGLSPSQSGPSPILEESSSPSVEFNPSLALPLAPSSYTRSPSLNYRGPRSRLIQEAIVVASDMEADDDASHDLMDVENLLESFFMHLDSTLHSLVQLGELVEDTEDLVNLSLDYARNKLIRFDIIITCGTFALSLFSAVASMLGENLPIPAVVSESNISFGLVNVGVIVFAAASFFLIIAVLVRGKLL